MVKKVAVKVTDLRIARYIVQQLNKFNTPASDNGDIIVDDKQINEIPLNKLIGYLVCKSRDKEEFNELLIGIDTNKEEKLTVVVIGDGELIYTDNTNMLNIEEVLEDLIHTFPHKRLYIGVGGGNKFGELIYRILKIKFNNVKLVNENKTSGKNPFISIKDRDIRAAYLIALRATL